MSATSPEIPLWLLGPFGLLLLLIATMPLTPPQVKQVWEHYYPHLSLGLAGIVGVYYLTQIPNGGSTLAHTLHEYFSFIALIGALFVVAGGIHIKVKGEATPAVNLGFLLIGAILANFIGTTGASMVLIRPWIRMNKIRISAFHLVFFIFIISNVGGALTPIGDPPLFIGYLRGVPFFWLLEHAIPAWIFTLGTLLAVFYVFDRRSFQKMPRRLQHEAAREAETWRIDGLANVLLLGIIIGGVFLPETYFFREIVMLAAATTSYFLTPKIAHLENAFTFAPIREVAFLFVGIFITMMPALGYLAAHGAELGFTRPIQYYFATGLLSSVLDNAPTYVNFLQLAQASVLAENTALVTAPGGVDSMKILLTEKSLHLVAISLGAVFFGALTYIGNGPNFMVKSIAHDAGVHCPSFFGYIFRYSLPILLPILALVGWLFM
ncbi:MAG: hypothetical protein RL077_887 [Verrucomicrobiota bacterium]|jgi:Na+/H+ antiporter NhaD/arsenite permease-like protein